MGQVLLLQSLPPPPPSPSPSVSSSPYPTPCFFILFSLSLCSLPRQSPTFKYGGFHISAAWSTINWVMLHGCCSSRRSSHNRGASRQPPPRLPWAITHPEDNKDRIWPAPQDLGRSSSHYLHHHPRPQAQGQPYNKAVWSQREPAGCGGRIITLLTAWIHNSCVPEARATRTTKAGRVKEATFVCLWIAWTGLLLLARPRICCLEGQSRGGEHAPWSVYIYYTLYKANSPLWWSSQLGKSLSISVSVMVFSG